jgi:nucleoside-diphosphate-sugar epimerase
VRVLLTGSLGYIGQIAEIELKARGHEVLAVDAGWFTQSILPDGNTFCTPIDLRNIDVDGLDGIEVVIHLAALSNDPMGELDKALTHSINFTAATRLARLAVGANVRRFIFMSSCSVYGDAISPADEKSPLRPLTAYAQSKVATEKELRGLSDRLEVVVLRASTAFGVSPNPRLDLVVNDFVWNAVMQGRVLLRSAGTAWRPLVAARDLGALCALFADRPVACGGYMCFNVGQDENCVQIYRLAELVAEELGVPVEMVPGAHVDARSYRPNFSRIRAHLKDDYEFTSLRSEISRLSIMYERYRSRFSHPEQFRRLDQLKTLIANGAITDDLFRS